MNELAKYRNRHVRMLLSGWKANDFTLDFICGFCDVAPASYDYEADVTSPVPKCKPWLSCAADMWLWFDPDSNAYDMGVLYAESDKRLSSLEEAQ